MSLSVDGAPLFESSEMPDRSGPYAGLSGYQGAASYDDVTIRGKLQRAWLEEALRKSGGM
jgi:hypothetical protein